jgi:enoyl-CoA hydratase/carnithine racemase
MSFGLRFTGEDVRLDVAHRVATITLDRPPVNAFRDADVAGAGRRRRRRRHE